MLLDLQRRAALSLEVPRPRGRPASHCCVGAQNSQMREMCGAPRSGQRAWTMDPKPSSHFGRIVGETDTIQKRASGKRARSVPTSRLLGKLPETLQNTSMNHGADTVPAATHASFSGRRGSRLTSPARTTPNCKRPKILGQDNPAHEVQAAFETGTILWHIRAVKHSPSGEGTPRRTSCSNLARR